MNDNQLLRYSRHILLPSIAYEGQEALTKSHALIVGAGGLGSPAALYMAAGGVGMLTICDFDDVDLTNLQRQIIHGQSDIGRPKAQSARDAIAERAKGRLDRVVSGTDPTGVTRTRQWRGMDGTIYRSQ